jgi:hypothetical protein
VQALIVRAANLALMFAVSLLLIRYSSMQETVEARNATASFMFLSAFIPLTMLGLNKTVFTLLRFDQHGAAAELKAAYFTLELFAIAGMAIFLVANYAISLEATFFLLCFGLVSMTSLRRDVYYAEHAQLRFELHDLAIKIVVVIFAMTASFALMPAYSWLLGAVALALAIGLHVKKMSLPQLLTVGRMVLGNRRVRNYTLAFLLFLLSEIVYYNLPGYYIKHELGAVELNKFNLWMRCFLIIVTGSRIVAEYKIAKRLPERSGDFIRNILLYSILLVLFFFLGFAVVSDPLSVFLKAPGIMAGQLFFVSLLGWALVNSVLHPIGIYLTYHPEGKIIALRGSIISALVMAFLLFLPAFRSDSAFQALTLALCAYVVNVFYSGVQLLKLMKNAKPAIA